MNKTAKDAVELYLNACYEGNGEMINQAFHESAHLYSLDADKALSDELRDEFAQHIDTPPSAKTLNAPREEEILMIDFSGEDTAIAKVAMLAHGTLYTDYLFLGRIQGDWKIVSKFYTGKKKE